MGQISKIILKGTGEGELRMGEQRKPWNNNIKEWIGCNISTLVHIAGDRKWGHTLITEDSIMTPQRLMARGMG